MHRAAVFDVENVTPRDDAPGITARAGYHEGIRYAIVEYAPGAGRDVWCEEPHQGFVLAGMIRYELPDGELLARAGQAFVLPPGTPHRGSNPGTEPARLYLVDHES
jgi:quercetin dioxygenase-like cupin family protein